MSQMCPNCSFDNPDEAKTCTNCATPLRALLGENTILSGRYQVTSVLGCGAMGAVYLADDQRLAGRRCAIKENRTDPAASPQALAQAREQFLAEASVLARLDHASLPKVSDYFIENDREYLVMDYVDGEDLESRLQRTGGPLPEELVVSVADQVLDALVYLHGQTPQPIIHRDIKPANLRLNVQNRVKLVDFGLVKLLDVNNPETKIELRGLGTPAYAPLEQFAGSEDHTDARSDIYSLGATLYHLLTSLYPPDVHQRLLHPGTLISPHELNAKLSKRVERVVLKAMEIYPADRYQSAAEMRQAFDEPEPTPKAAAVPAGAKSRSVLTTLLATIGLIVVLGLLGAFAFMVFNRERTDASPISNGGTTEGPLTATATELIPQSLSDAPTGTPTATSLVEEVAATAEATPTPEPSPTATPTPNPTVVSPVSTPTSVRLPTASQSGGIPESTLRGTIAYPVFNGTTYDLYFGQADGSGTRLFRQQASQPAFSPDGSRIAFHSWRLDSWGLINADTSGGNEVLFATFVEDQLPTWSADGSEIVFLSRREGDRKSRLIKVGSFQQRANGAVLGEGEYPTIGSNNRLIFRGWGNSGTGVRSANLGFNDLQAITEVEVDTAPAPSPDGRRVAFMSRREGNWDIYVINADGSNLQRLTDDPAEDGLPTWSPDGEAIAFVSSRGGTWAVWATTPDGEDQRQLFPMEGSPDGFVGSNVATAATRGWAEERISWTR